MGIVNIEDDLHDQVRKESRLSYRSINAQAAYWIRVGMLAESYPSLSFTQIMEQERESAGISARPLALNEIAGSHDEAA